MADNIEIKINTAIDDANAAKSLGELKKSLKELVSLSGQVDGKQFDKLAKQINHTEDQLGNLNDTFKTLRGSGVERLDSSFNLLKEGFSSFDGEKISGAFKGIGSAMSAIPLILIIEGVKYLVENFKELSEGSGAIAKSLQFVGTIITGLKESFNLLTDSLGLTNTGLETLRDNTIKNAKDIKEALTGTLKGYDNLAAVASAQGKSTVKIEEQKQLAIIQTNNEIIRGMISQIKHGQELNDEQKKQLKEAFQNIEDAGNARRVVQIKNYEKENKDAEEAHKKALEEFKKHQKELYDAYIAARDKATDSTREAGVTIAKIEADNNKKIQDQQNKADNTALNNELNKFAEIKAAEKLSTQDKIDELTRRKDIELAVEGKGLNEKVAIQKKYNDDVQKLRDEDTKAAGKAVKDSISEANKAVQTIGQLATQVVNAIQAFAELAAQKREQEEAAIQKSADTQVSILEDQKNKELNVQGLSQEQKDAINHKYAEKEYQLQLQAYNKETELKKKTFETDKKFRIVQTVISTITGSMAALTSAMSSLPYPAGLIAGLISATAVTAIGIAQVLKIKNQQFDAGTPPTPPPSGGGSGGVSSSVGSANPNPGQNFNENVIGQASNAGTSAAQREAQNNPPQRVYVTETDITKTQNKVSVIQQKATIG